MEEFKAKIGMKLKSIQGEWERTFNIIGLDDLYGNVYMKRDQDGMVFKVKENHLPKFIKDNVFQPTNFKVKEV